ncbi:hypothetical protein HWB92_gp013 [Serratia phage vB_SmaA_3M]|uniref:DUF7254 domain-containing protein n=1 Tax=Serratia phage vB_SmaA_3M TaxID=2419930 RepID=A0A3G2YS06_9CAUD|nr:hypothetical protein HWB92_gp013 [Serratia phage vB_SmaA_3M]AYP28271.1 hypothetical protein 3M_013c [Serratia phage vB_SmaA_3M]
MEKFIVSSDGDVINEGLGKKLHETCLEFARTSTNPISLATRMHARLVDLNIIDDSVDIVYDFDARYRIRFQHDEQPYYFETWCTWQGALNWKISFDKEAVA